MAGVKTLQAAIEAILFTMGESVELSKIAKAIEQDEQTTEELLQDLMKKYESKNRGIRIIELDKSYQMCTKKEMYDYLIRVAKQPKKYTLTDVLLETMSIITVRGIVNLLNISLVAECRIFGEPCNGQPGSDSPIRVQGAWKGTCPQSWIAEWCRQDFP